LLLQVTTPSRQGLQEEGQPPPLALDELPPVEEPLATVHDPPLHTPPDTVQSTQVAPPAPQRTSIDPDWQDPVESQQPAQVAGLQEPGAPVSPPPSSPLLPLVEDPPPSSPELLPEPLMTVVFGFDAPEPPPWPPLAAAPPLLEDEAPGTLPRIGGRPSSEDAPLQSGQTTAAQTKTPIRSTS
jgi:hypothetical protein